MQLEELHDILYNVLCTVDDICKQNSITYSLGGGTLLGAVRHKGFIPWDDDVDICLWRKDYDRMRTALKDNLPPYMKLIEPIDFCPNFFDFVCRVVDTRYSWHTSSEEDTFYQNLQNYVGVDIFFIDYSANTINGVRWFAFQQKILYGLAMGHRYKIKSEKYTLLQKIQTSILSFIGSKIKMEDIIRLQDKLSKKHDNKEHKYCMVTNDIPKYFNLPYESSWFDGVTYLTFRDRLLPVQVGYHMKLTLQYGNYMEPPKKMDEYIQHFTIEK